MDKKFLLGLAFFFTACVTVNIYFPAAAVQRAALPPHERRPSFVYIDEAQDYFDENISNLFEFFGERMRH